MKDLFKEKFSYTAVDLADNININSAEVIPALVENNDFLSRVVIQDGVPADSTFIVKLFDVDPELQEMTNCGFDDAGTVAFTQVELTSKRVGIELFLCNNSLNNTWAQLLLRSGAKDSLESLPIEQQMLALTRLKLEKKVQDLIFKGDTGSGNSELAMFNGLIKKFKNDPLIPAFTNAGAVTASNAFAIFKGVSRTVATEVRDNGLAGEIICSQVDFNHLVDNLLTDNNYHYTAERMGEGNSQTMMLPGTSDTVRVVPQLSTGEIYFVPYSYVMVSTNLEGDLQGVFADYLIKERTLRLSAIMDIGVNYARPQYFAKYDEASS
jgi:hypothetical protein